MLASWRRLRKMESSDEVVSRSGKSPSFFAPLAAKSPQKCRFPGAAVAVGRSSRGWRASEKALLALVPNSRASGTMHLEEHQPTLSALHGTSLCLAKIEIRCYGRETKATRGKCTSLCEEGKYALGCRSTIGFAEFSRLSICRFSAGRQTLAGLIHYSSPVARIEA